MRQKLEDMQKEALKRASSFSSWLTTGRSVSIEVKGRNRVAILLCLLLPKPPYPFFYTHFYASTLQRDQVHPFIGSYLSFDCSYPISCTVKSE